MPDIVHDKVNKFFIIRKSGYRVEKICQCFLKNLDGLFEFGTIHKPGTRTHAVSAYISGEQVFIKRYNIRSFWYMLSHSFTLPRAILSWRSSLKLKKLGIPVPEPLICAVERYGGILRRSYLLTETIADSRGLKFSWPFLQTDEKLYVLQQLGYWFGVMHKGGFYHGDLKWTNILLKRSNFKEIFLIDFDGSAIKLNSLSENMAKKDLSRFLYDLRHLSECPDMEKVFLRSWAEGYRGLK